MDQNNDWKHLREDARALSDEIRLQVHLAGMDAKRTFDQLNKQADKLALQLGGDAKEAWGNLIDRLKDLRDQILTDIR